MAWTISTPVSHMHSHHPWWSCHIQAYDIHGSISAVGGRKPGTTMDVFTASSGQVIAPCITCISHIHVGQQIPGVKDVFKITLLSYKNISL